MEDDESDDEIRKNVPAIFSHTNLKCLNLHIF